MTEQKEKSILKNTFDLTLSGLQTDPYLAQKIIHTYTKGEEPVKKKISFTFILANLLVLAAVTAFAVSIGNETPDKQPLVPLPSVSPLPSATPSNPYNILSLAAASDIAKDAIRTQYGVPDEEIKQLMLYPYSPVDTYGSDAPWVIVFYSNPNRIFNPQDTYTGPLGEYRVEIHQTTGEVLACEWSSIHFWNNAQRIWDAGNYDAVYHEYYSTSFLFLSPEEQAYYTRLLKEKGYAVQAGSDRNLEILAFGDQILLTPLEKILDDTDPQADAAWKRMITQYHIDIDILKSYSYVATRAPWNSETDDIVIAYNIPSAVDKHTSGKMDACSYFLYPEVQRMGIFVISFEKGTCRILYSTQHYTYDNIIPSENNNTLLNNPFWGDEELLQFHQNFLHLETMMDRMDAVNATVTEKTKAASAYMIELGSANLRFFRMGDTPLSTRDPAASTPIIVHPAP
ncbi:MAG: hypothetical protein IJ968_05160 [Clostridia bacterium]|nr:hypothetical protein [Clostridia bacterium]